MERGGTERRTVEREGLPEGRRERQREGLWRGRDWEREGERQRRTAKREMERRTVERETRTVERETERRAVEGETERRAAEGETERRTAARGLTCVSALMPLQLVRPGEPPAAVAEVTLVRLLPWR